MVVIISLKMVMMVVMVVTINAGDQVQVQGPVMQNCKGQVGNCQRHRSCICSSCMNIDLTNSNTITRTSELHADVHIQHSQVSALMLI